MSAKATASLNNSVAAQAPAKTGAGQAGLTAIATTVLTKAVATTPISVLAATTHSGLGTAVPATAAGFDRTVATSLGK